jgi:hypothetical protein
MMLTMGHKQASIMGAKNIGQPIKLPDNDMRSTMEMACEIAKRGKTCKAWEGTENHNKRRWIKVAKKPWTV